MGFDGPRHDLCHGAQTSVRCTAEALLRLFGNVSTAPNYNTRAACLLPDGSMVEGTSDGFQFFNPEALCGPEQTQARLKRMLLLMGMRVNGAPFSRKTVHFQDSIVSLSLNDDERNIVLYTLPRDVNYAGVRNFSYRLDDEEGWQLIDNFRISLSHLSYGSHKISIEEMDPMSGARTEYLLATIHVAYPWYLSVGGNDVYFTWRRGIILDLLFVSSPSGISL